MKKSFLAAVLVVMTASLAGASTINTFGCLSTAAQCTPNIGSQLAIDVFAGTGTYAGSVGFTFSNTAVIASSITDLYFDSRGGTLSLPMQLLMSAGVKFAEYATPANLPDANNASPAFVTTLGFSADSANKKPGVLANGVNASTEWVTIYLKLASGKTLTDVENAIGNGGLRIGMHVQGIAPTGFSAAYINVPPPPPPTTTTATPEPGTLVLLGSGLLAMGRTMRKRLAKQ